MSLRTRINGFTAWVNLRLSPSGHFMHNILTDLLKGYNMKVLLESKRQCSQILLDLVGPELA